MANPKVELHIANHGVIVLELDAEKAPLSAANFLSYVNKGHYNNTVFHRVIPGFMVQGGGYTREFRGKPTLPPVVNESQNGLRNDRGTLAAAITTAVLFKGKIDATMVFNGVIGGLVSITAEPLAPTIGEAVLIGAVGGVLVVLSVRALDMLKIDDVVGAIPAHLVCGIWGTMIVPFSNSGATYVGQGVGVVLTGVFVVAASTIIWLVLKFTLGVRASEEEEIAGMDRTEVGLEAYPEFSGR